MNELDMRDGGSIMFTLPSQAAAITLRPPTFGELARLMRALDVVRDQVASVGAVQSILSTTAQDEINAAIGTDEDGEQRTRAMDEDAAARVADIRANLTKRRHELLAEQHGAVAGWWVDVIATLAPEQRRADPLVVENLPRWCANLGVAQKVYEHWTNRPFDSGDGEN